jgi:hypothetical protein
MTVKEIVTKGEYLYHYSRDSRFCIYQVYDKIKETTTIYAVILDDLFEATGVSIKLTQIGGKPL